jgi:hypothetical protein
VKEVLDAAQNMTTLTGSCSDLFIYLFEVYLMVVKSGGLGFDWTLQPGLKC